MGLDSSKPRRQLDGQYWDDVARQWDDEIFNTLAHDANGVIVAELKKAARGKATAADFGCGVGVYLPTLARLFREVHGFEQSEACVALARKRVRTKPGVQVHVSNRAPHGRREQFDVVLCVNAALHPRKRVWQGVLRSAGSLLKPRGRLIVVVPSLESAALMLAAEQHIQQNGGSTNGVQATQRQFRSGVICIEGAPTKHFRRAELTDALGAIGLGTVQIRRVEYSWNSHGIVPPRSMRKTRLWDWIAVGRLGAS